MEREFANGKKMAYLLGLVLLLGLGLAGCAEDKPAADLGNQAERPALLYYYDGVITTEGDLLFPPGENEYQILLDKQNRQRYVLETENHFDPERQNSYGEALLLGCTFRIYDVQGGLQKELAVQAEGNVNDTVNFYFAADGSLEKSRILVNRLLTEGSLQVLDCDGNLLLTEQVLQPAEISQWQQGYANLTLADNFMNIVYDLYNYNAYSDENNMQGGNFFYDLSGQPLESAHKYGYFYNVYDEYNNCVSDYYVAAYEGPQGQFLYDVLDSNGQVLISGLNLVEHFSDSVFVVQQGFNRGLMDAQGNWIYQESQFADLED